MIKSNAIQRVLLFVVAIPAIAAAIFFLPHFSHLFINLATIIACYLGSKELLLMLENKGIKLNRKYLPILSIPLPLTSYLIVQFKLNPDLFLIVLTSLILFVLFTSVSTKQSNDDFSNNIIYISSSLFVILYPGFFMSYIIRFSEFENSSMIICYFIIIVFLNDSGAWLLGVLFGKKNRGVVKVSKNKSVMGFVGGTIGTYLFMGFARYYIPELQSMPIYMYIILSGILSLVTITGDLVESAIKRSSNVKDSGNVILGRGGLLDSIDSLLLVAPLFYYIVKAYSKGM